MQRGILDNKDTLLALKNISNLPAGERHEHKTTLSNEKVFVVKYQLLVLIK